MPFPFLFLVLSLSAGIIFSSIVFLPSWIMIFFLVASLASAWSFLFILKKIKTSFILSLLTTFFIGSILYIYSNKNYEENTLHKFRTESYADFYGTLYKSPSHGNERDYLFLKTEKVFYRNLEENIEGNLRIAVPHSKIFPSKNHLLVKDKVKVSAQVIPFRSYKNFSNSSLDYYWKSQSIHNKAFSKSPLLIEKLESGKEYYPLRLISIIRQNIQKKIEYYFGSISDHSLSSQGGVLEALLLGARGRMDRSITISLQKTGLYHLFAISGAHLAIISFIFFLFFKMLRIPNRISYLLLIFFLAFYAFLVEGRPSVIRATVMTLAFLVGKLIWKNVNLINTISFSAFFLLLSNPFNLFNLGFQLTFAATFSIILFFTKVIKYIPKLPLKIDEMFALSLTAQIGVLPFIANAFNRVTFTSLILNFAAFPLVGLIMFCGYSFLSFSFISPFLGEIFSKIIIFLINLLTHVSQIFDSVSFMSYRIPKPHIITILGYFFFLLFLLVHPKFKKQKIILGICFLIFFLILVTYPFPSVSKNLKVTFIDVGQGDCILVEFPGRKKMLIDGGGVPGDTFDIGENVVSPFLWRKGIKKIDYLVLTHSHPDHLNGLKAVARNFKIGEYWETFSPLEDKKYLELKALLSPKIKQKRMFRGTTVYVKDVKIEVLHPEKANFIVFNAHNDQSLVLKVSYGKISFLFTGDISKKAEKEILKNFYNIKSQVLKSPHHGSLSSSSMEFLKKVSPKIIVISVGERNLYGFPNPEILKRYEEISAEVYRTDTHGAIEISSDGYTISTLTAF